MEITKAVGKAANTSLNSFNSLEGDRGSAHTCTHTCLTSQSAFATLRGLQCVYVLAAPLWRQLRITCYRSSAAMFESVPLGCTRSRDTVPASCPHPPKTPKTPKTFECCKYCLLICDLGKCLFWGTMTNKQRDVDILVTTFVSPQASPQCHRCTSHYLPLLIWGDLSGLLPVWVSLEAYTSVTALRFRYY